MKLRVMTAVLGVAVGLLATTTPASAFGGRLLGGRGNDCGGCGTVVAAPACGGCGVAVAPAMVEQEVTVWEAKETKSKQKVKVMKPFEVEKEVTCKVFAPVTVKREVTTYQMVKVEKPVEVTSYEWVAAKEEREVVSYSMQPKKVTVDVVNYVCTPRTVTEMATVTHKVPVCPDPCAGFLARLCGPKFTCVTSCQPVCRTVVDRVPVVTKVERVVNECVATKTKQMVDVMKCQPVKRMVNQVSYECKPSKQMVDVVECQWVDKKEKVKVWECKEVEEEMDVVKVEWVQAKRKVMVPAPTPCATTTAGCGGCGGCAAPVATCGSACDTCGGRTGLFNGRLLAGFGGLFNRGCGCN